MITIIDNAKLIEWTKTTIVYYLNHCCGNKKAYLEEVIKWCEKQKEKL